MGPLIAIIAGIVLVSALPLDHQNILSNTHANEILEVLGDHFEGDILLNEHQRGVIFGDSRNGIIDVDYRWPNKTIIYQLTSNHTDEQNEYIEEALRKLSLLSCLKFVHRTNQEDYIEISNRHSGCYSYVGRQGGKQILNLQPFEPGTGCFQIGTITHEFLHAAGFYHMQSASDRDEYVKIEWSHILKGKEHNFFKFNSSFVSHFDEAYDYESIMHYPAYGFTKDGYATIVPKNITYIKSIGKFDQLSPIDIRKLNAMYKC